MTIIHLKWININIGTWFEFNGHVTCQGQVSNGHGWAVLPSGRKKKSECEMVYFIFTFAVYR